MSASTLFVGTTASRLGPLWPWQHLRGHATMATLLKSQPLSLAGISALAGILLLLPRPELASACMLLLAANF